MDDEVIDLQKYRIESAAREESEAKEKDVESAAEELLEKLEIAKQDPRSLDTFMEDKTFLIGMMVGLEATKAMLSCPRPYTDITGMFALLAQKYIGIEVRASEEID